MAFVELPTRRRSPQLGIAALVIVAVAVLVFGRTICSYVIDYFWWREMGQVPTWLRMTGYRYLPGLAAWLIVFPALWAGARAWRKTRRRTPTGLAALCAPKYIGSGLRGDDCDAFDSRRLDRGALRGRPRSCIIGLGPIRCSARRSRSISSTCRFTACC